MRQLLRFAFFLLFSFLAVYIEHIQHIWVLFHHFSHISFLFLFVSSVSFIFRIDPLATRETIIAVLFCLFSDFYCFLSHIYIWIALISWFYLVLVLVAQEPQEGDNERCERVRILIVFGFFFTINQFLQVL